MKAYLVMLISLAFFGCATPPVAECPDVARSAPATAPQAPSSGRESRLAESYRYHLGSAYMHALLTALHLNDMLLARLDAGSFDERDRTILSDNLVGLRDMQTQFRNVLNSLYDDPQKEQRDRKILPLIDNITRMSEALERYANDGLDDDLVEYSRQRERFVNGLRQLSEGANRGT